jgi:diguanylate cyclase (GGDEF)-like protein
MTRSSSTSTDAPGDAPATRPPARPVTIEQVLQTNEELDRRIFDLQALLKAGEALYERLEVEASCELLMAMCRERLRVERLAVLLFAENPDQLVLRAAVGLDVQPRLAVPASDGILWRLLRAGEPFSVVGRSGAPRFPHIWRQHGLDVLQAQLFVPLVMADRVVGVLTLGLDIHGRPVSEGDYLFLSTLASQASVALNTARLYESIEIERSKQARSFHQLEILFDVTKKLSEISDLARMLGIILRKAIKAVDASKGSLMLADDSGQELVVRVVEGLPDLELQRRINDGEVECRRFRRGEGIAGRVWASGEPLRIAEAGADARFAAASGTYVRSLICVPMIVDDETLGVINITNRRGGGDFAEADLSILGALAHQAAAAIARARLYEAAITDGLTGLSIRRFVLARLREEVRRAERYEHPLSVVLCDVDHFKRVNDTHGHLAGDAVLRSVAATLKVGVRQGVDLVGRYGGEEFVLVLPETDAAGAATLADRLRGDVAGCRPEHDGVVVDVTMSLGVAQVVPGESVEDALGRADRALYAAKNGGRNLVVVDRPVPAAAPEPLPAIETPPPVHTDAPQRAVPPTQPQILAVG